MTAEQIRDSVNTYMDDVLSGRIVAGQLERAAVRRHLQDLEAGERRGLYFEESDPVNVIIFASFLIQFEGAFEGRPLHLEPWEMFIIWVLFGWKRRANGKRRFRKAYIEVARKNGKSSLAGVLVLWCLAFDGEGGAQVFTAATKRDQAAIVWQKAKGLLLKSPGLKDLIDVSKTSLFVEDTMSSAIPLSADHDTQDGLNPHLVVLDEYHAHPNGMLHDVLISGMQSRPQPLMFIITTAGFDRGSACFAENSYVRLVLGGQAENDDLFGVIYTFDEGDDWTDSRLWRKSNPNLGVSIPLEAMEAEFREAMADPRKENNFKTKHLNIWTSTTSRWITAEAWARTDGIIDQEALRGRRCFGAMDLSSVSDLTGYALDFPPEEPNEPHVLLVRAYVPEETLKTRALRETQHYLDWVKTGRMTATPGATQNYDFIQRDLEADAKLYRLMELAYDPYQAGELVRRLEQSGITCVSFSQSISSMSPASKAFERSVKEGMLNAGGDPVLAWMIDKTQIYTDANGNIKPIKPDTKAGNVRIDLVICGIMAHYRTTIVEQKAASVYETRGLVLL